MVLHRNARLGLAGRRALVADIESGCSCREAARRRGVSPTTACKWWRRWLQASPEQRQTLACFVDRSSRPHRCPRLEVKANARRSDALARSAKRRGMARPPTAKPPVTPCLVSAALGRCGPRLRRFLAGFTVMPPASVKRS